MTKQEAYKRLELSDGADLQEVRRKFAELYNDYRMRIDNAPTARMRQTYEQHLEAVKEAYALLNESDSMDDTGDLPRTQQTGAFDILPEQHNPSGNSAGEADIDRALAVFGLSADQPAAVIVRIVRKHLAELRQQYTAVSLPAAKAAYQQEIAKAEAVEEIIRTWLNTHHADAELEEIHHPEASETTQVPMPEEAFRQRRTGVPVWLIALLVVILLGGGYWWWSNKGQVKPAGDDVLAVASLDSVAADSTTQDSVLNGKSPVSPSPNRSERTSSVTFQKDFDAIKAIENSKSEEALEKYRTLLRSIPVSQTKERRQVNDRIAMMERAITTTTKQQSETSADDELSGNLKPGDDVKAEGIEESIEMPIPPGGMQAFLGWVGENYDYPAAAIDAGVNGRVEVSFVVERDGSLTDFKIVRHLRFGTGEALIETLKKSPKWTPGMQNGRPVRVAYTIPIRLNLTE